MKAPRGFPCKFWSSPSNGLPALPPLRGFLGTDLFSLNTLNLPFARFTFDIDAFLVVVLVLHSLIRVFLTRWCGPFFQDRFSIQAGFFAT